MKILILANSGSGLWAFRRELIAELQKSNTIVAAAPMGKYAELLEGIGCRTIHQPMDRRGVNPVKDLKILHQYRKLIRQEKPDLVITYTIKSNIYGGLAARRKKIPYAVNITGLGTAFEREGLLKKLVVYLYRSAMKRAKVVYFENEGDRQTFVQERITPDEKTCLLMGAGVNLDRYRVTEYPAGDVTKFLFVGRIMREKGVDELFAAMRKLLADGEKVELHLVGSSEENYRPAIEQAEGEGWLKFHGFQRDVTPFIQDCHCFVLPSWHEGMANTNLENASGGRPVITSRIHGCLEAVEENVTGYLCERKNADSLYEVMKKFVHLPYEQRKAMGLAGRKRMEDVFDKKKVVAATIARLK